MSTSERYADLVVGIPYGSEGKKRWIKVGTMLKLTPNDETKGPGLVIMLDKHFNPAGIQTRDPNASSIALSTYWIDETRRAATPASTPLTHRGVEDDDIPF